MSLVEKNILLLIVEAHIYIYFSLLDEGDNKKLTLVRPNQLMFHESEMDKGMYTRGQNVTHPISKALQ